jgi:23S rRNA-/tRNA-specific pseudouridylate synthase
MPEEIPLDVVYEDGDLAVVKRNRPVGEDHRRDSTASG